MKVLPLIAAVLAVAGGSIAPDSARADSNAAAPGLRPGLTPGEAREAGSRPGEAAAKEAGGPGELMPLPEARRSVRIVYPAPYRPHP